MSDMDGWAVYEFLGGCLILSPIVAAFAVTSYRSQKKRREERENTEPSTST